MSATKPRKRKPSDSDTRKWYAKANPRLEALRDEMVRENGGPLLRFAPSCGGVRYKLPCGFTLSRSTLYAFKRRGWIRRVQPFCLETRRETWVVTA